MVFMLPHCSSEQLAAHRNFRNFSAEQPVAQFSPLPCLDARAVAWIDGKTYQSPMCELDVVDRVGGGDGYAAGFFYGLLSGASEQEAVNLGWSHGALLTTFPGDTTMATVEQVKAFAKGGSARIQR